MVEAPLALKFMSPEWAEAAREAYNAGPSDEVKAGKLDKYWDWIDHAKTHVDCTLGLAVEGLPSGAECVLLELEQGVCSKITLASRARAEELSTYLLAGTYSDWQEILAGYDMGKTIMYRKLRLVRGELLDFFKSAYYWTETLACLQRVPTRYQ